jgi:hypothetical protein
MCNLYNLDKRQDALRLLSMVEKADEWVPAVAAE